MGRTKDFESDTYIKERIQAFYKKIKIDENGCWLWLGSTNEKYGVIRFKNLNLSAHRFSFLYIKKEKITNKCVCHSCDKPLCVNPDHLFLGSYKDNMVDAKLKKRVAFGEKHYQCKLKEKDVQEILKLLKVGFSQTEIADIFKIEQTNISHIFKGKNWKHIEKKYDPEILIKCFCVLRGELETYKMLKFYDHLIKAYT